MTVAGLWRTTDTRAARWSRTAVLSGAISVLVTLAAAGLAQALCVAEATAWSLVLAALALRVSAGASPSSGARHDDPLGALLVTALGLSTARVVALLVHRPGPAHHAAHHLPVVSCPGAGISTLRVLVVTASVLALAAMTPARRTRAVRLGALGMAMTLTAADLGGLDLLTAPMAALAWLLAGWSVLVARERTRAMPALEGRRRRMLLFAVSMQLALELVAVGVHPTWPAMRLLSWRYGLGLVLCTGRSPLMQRLVLGWTGLTALDLMHRSVAHQAGWSMVDAGAVLAAGTLAMTLAPTGEPVRTTSTAAA